MGESGAARGTSSAAIGLEQVPAHVGFIMDGNGRWAQARGLPRVAGHRAGTQNLRVLLRTAKDVGIRVVTFFAFSTENWQRPSIEVRALLALMEQLIDAEIDNLDKEGVQIRHLGRSEGVPVGLLGRLRSAEARTAHNSALTMNIAFNYGGRADIVDAVRRVVAEGLAPEEISEETISQRLSTAGQPDPDLIIRTAGEMRLSNFLIWQASYAEFYSTPVYWPDFGREEFLGALRAFEGRQRRFGRVASTQA